MSQNFESDSAFSVLNGSFCTGGGGSD